MDISTIIASGASIVLGITAVSSFLGKVLPQTVKYAVLAKDAVNALDDVVESLQDGKLTPDEIAKVQADIIKFKADLK